MNHQQKYELVKQANPLMKYLAVTGLVAPHHALMGAGIGSFGNLALGSRDRDPWDRFLRGGGWGATAGTAMAIPSGILLARKAEKMAPMIAHLQKLQALKPGDSLSAIRNLV